MTLDGILSEIKIIFQAQKWMKLKSIMVNDKKRHESHTLESPLFMKCSFSEVSRERRSICVVETWEWGRWRRLQMDKLSSSLLSCLLPLTFSLCKYLFRMYSAPGMLSSKPSLKVRKYIVSRLPKVIV